MKTKNIGSIKEQNIYFFEVEKKDEKLLKQAFPKAKIIREALTEKNVKSYKNAEGICTFIYSELSASIIKALPKLKIIVTRSVGYNHIDLKVAEQKRVVVCNVPDYGSHVIAEHAFALLLSAVRNVIEGEERTEHDQFDWKGLRGIALRGKTLGVVGTGKIGLHVCRIASLGFQMKVLAYDLYPNQEKARDYHFEYVNSLDEIWKHSDFITLHTPLFPSTEHMVNDKTVQKMKKGVVLVNTARGELIDTPALIKGIKSGKIAEAALDVVEHEKNLKKHEEIFHLKNVIVTPHIAFYADDSIVRMYEDAIDSIQRLIEGRDIIHQVHGR